MVDSVIAPCKRHGSDTGPIVQPRGSLRLGCYPSKELKSATGTGFGTNSNRLQDAQKGQPTRPQGAGRLRRTFFGTSQGDRGYPLHGLVQWVVRTKLGGLFQHPV